MRSISFVAALIPLLLATGAPALGQAQNPPPELAGDWSGRLSAGAMTLRVVIHLKPGAGAGPWSATLDSIDQGAKGIPVSAVTFAEGKLRLDLPNLRATYEATPDAAKRTLDGVFTQNGIPLPLKLERTEKPFELSRPQNPKPPFPYRVEEVRIENKEAAGVTLAGTFTCPEGKGPFPALLLLSGSGPQDRDETIFGHQPFWVWADFLTRRGFAVLRLDDRGFGKSTGTHSTSTMVDFASDAKTAVAWLRSQAVVDGARVGLMGHSEGGVVAPMVASVDARIAFLVLLAGSAVKGEEVLIAQSDRIREGMGVAANVRGPLTEAARDLYALVRQPAGPERDSRLRHQIGVAAGQTRMSADMVEGQFRMVTSPWFRHFLDYDPAPALRALRCPVLALNGEKDWQVLPSQNLPALQAAFRDSGNKNTVVKELPGLNHLFQKAATGAISEYGQIEQTVDPTVLEEVAKWLEGVTGPRRRGDPL